MRSISTLLWDALLEEHGVDGVEDLEDKEGMIGVLIEQVLPVHWFIVINIRNVIPKALVEHRIAEDFGGRELV